MTAGSTFPFRRAALALLVLALASSCDPTPRPTSEPPAATVKPDDPDVLAVVNGQPILEQDVEQALTEGRHNDKDPTPATRKAVLERLIEQELAYQRAMSLGMDGDPDYHRDLRRAEARLHAMKRKNLSEIYFRAATRAAVEVSDAEAKEYFARHEDQIRTDLHIKQILYQEEAPIERALRDLEGGAPFDEVAGKRFEGLSQQLGQPWDLGWLKWGQLPEPWLDVVYDLEIGQTSGIIRGPNERRWIVQVVEKRVNPDATFESNAAIIRTVIERSRISDASVQAREELREGAKIEYRSPKGGDAG